MSTWSSHPPRPDRSRSPSRAYYGRPSYPETGYPGDPYWDSYNRDRAWPDYDRERGGYDHGRRGRSRSPQYDDGRKRRRSMSPYDRERFDPRPRYGDYDDAHSRGYGHMSPRSRSQYGHGYPSRSSRGPPDPRTLDYPATLKQYAEWFRYYCPQQANEEDIADKAAENEAGDGSKPRNGIKTRWEKYKKEFLAQQLQTLFDHHRKSPWFAEKYDPSSEFVNLRKRVRRMGWRGRLNQFLNDLEEGKFDPNLNENDTETANEMKDEANGENGTLESPKQIKKEDDDFNDIGGDDDAADNETRFDSNGRGTNDGGKSVRNDEVSVYAEGNQVMIRTIPPDIGRVKLEAAMKDLPGFVYLALGDPMQKRNYYRAGWIKFTEDADIPSVITTLGEKKIEGFKLHMTHSTKPFVNKIRQTPEVANKPERIAKDLEQVKALVKLLEAEYDQVRVYKEEKSTESNEDSTVKVEESMNDDSLEQIDEEMTEPGERGSDAVERRIEKIRAEMPESTTDQMNVVALDLYLAYLRAAYHTCYYCVCTTDNLEELQRKCIKHVRKPLSKSQIAELEQKMVKKEEDESEKDAEKADKETEKGKPSKDRSSDSKRTDERWLDWLDNKVALLINRDGIDPRDYGGKSYEEELAKAVEPLVKQEDEGKFRCKTCSKLFKATSFVEKHVTNKHAELIKQLDELPYFNNFALDPQRIQPFTHPPAATSGVAQAPPQAYGLQGPSNYMDNGRPPLYMNPYQMFNPFANGMPPMEYGYPPQFPYAPPPPMRGGRDDVMHSGGGGGGGRRLSDRISGYAAGHEQMYQGAPSSGPGHGIEGLPAKPMVATLEPGPGGRKNGKGGVSGPPPPPPPDAKEDPRAAAGRKVSYHDMDLVAEGDVELNY